MSNLNIEWVKCHHGIEKRAGCPLCEKEKSEWFRKLSDDSKKKPTRVPIYRGCSAREGCFCSGKCKEIVGYRDPINIEGHII